MGKSQKQATDDSDDGHETRKEVVKSTPTTNSLPVLYYPKFEPDQRWLRSVLLLVDEVVRIIPKDAGHADSLQTRKLSDEIPGCLKSISPTDNDIAVDFINFNRLEKAFAQIRAKNRGRSPKNLRINIDGGRFRVEGNVWLSNSKLEPQIRELLIKYDLADMASPIAEMVPFENAILANEDASGLIVSHIADRIARRTGWDTMTDEPSQCLEYILVHELTHLVERHHNDRFISLMNRHLPNWRQHRQVLKSEPLAHDTWTY